MQQAKTEQQRYRFTVKMDVEGTPWVMLEPMIENLSILKNGVLGLQLAEGTTYDQAIEIAAYLNSHIKEVSCTISK